MVAPSARQSAGVGLLGSQFGPQIGWLFPLSLLVLVAGLVAWRRASRADPIRAGFVMWGVWLATFGVVLSEMGVVLHTAYVASLAPPAAALSGAGIVIFGRWYRAREQRGLLLPIAVAVELVWAVYLWSSYPGFLPWARWAAIVVGAVATVALIAAWPRWRDRRARAAAPSARAGARDRAGGGVRGRLAVAGLVAGVAALLVAPAAWALSVLDPVYAGNSFDATAGPGGAGPLPGPLRVTVTLNSPERRIYAYVTAHRGGARYLMAVQSPFEASPYIVATGQEVLPIGGFSGFAPEPTLGRIRQLVSGGQLRFFLLGGGQAGPAGRNSDTELYKITSWVEKSCRPVPALGYRAAPPVNARHPSATGGPITLYECSTR
jgi:hypothetical protein